MAKRARGAASGAPAAWRGAASGAPAVPTFRELTIPAPSLAVANDRPALSNLLVNAAPERLICSICTELCFPEPRQCLNGHTYHLECITLSLAHRESCPECRSPLTPDTLGRNLLAEDTLQGLSVRCRYHASGCTATIVLADAPAHERDCDFALCSCPHDGCEWTGLLHHAPAHLAACSLRIVSCCCGELVRVSDHPDHARTTCGCRLISCPMCAAGEICAAAFQEHVAMCEPAKLLLGPLSAQVQALRTQVPNLESSIQASDDL